MTLEREVEAAFRRLGLERGALVLKFVSPGCAGVPDRIVVRPGGTVEFVELKRPGEKPRPLQRAMFAKLAERGCEVSVVDSAEAAREWWASRDGGAR